MEMDIVKAGGCHWFNRILFADRSDTETKFMRKGSASQVFCAGGDKKIPQFDRNLRDSGIKRILIIFCRR